MLGIPFLDDAITKWFKPQAFDDPVDRLNYFITVWCPLNSNSHTSSASFSVHFVDLLCPDGFGKTIRGQPNPMLDANGVQGGLGAICGGLLLHPEHILCGTRGGNTRGSHGKG
jgi:hypothetical protein